MNGFELNLVLYRKLRTKIHESYWKNENEKINHDNDDDDDEILKNPIYCTQLENRKKNRNVHERNTKRKLK